VVFLDEPTGGVDPEARRMFWDVIDDLSTAGTTVFVTTHYMDEAERCHRVALMHAGKLLALDTLPGLKRAFRGAQVIEVACSRPAAAIVQLQGLDGVSDAALFGDRLHVVVEDPGAADTVRTRLEQTGHGPVQIRRVVPSLEGCLHPRHPGSREREGSMIRRLAAVAVKELLQLRRDWRTALTLLGMPVLLLLIYGYALSFDVEHVRLAVLDRSGTSASRSVVEGFFSSGYFERVATVP
jgi:energy-coupling factor transporter ATP-binding protein EcfA2